MIPCSFCSTVQRWLPLLIALTSLFSIATPAAAIENEFLPNGGIRYLLSHSDFAFEQATDSSGVNQIDSPSGWMNRGLCVVNGQLNSSLRVSLEQLAARIATNAQGDQLGGSASSVGDNLKYCIANGQSATLLNTMPVHFAAAGRVTVRVTYSTEGLYAGIASQGQLSAIELQRIFNAVLYLETFADDDSDVGGGGGSIEALNGLPRIADLPWSTYGSGFGRTVRTSDRHSQTTTQDFDITERTVARLKIMNKAYGFWLRIDGIEMTYIPY